MSSNLKEYFSVVDEEDTVIGKETRAECHRCKLIHRSVYIFVINYKNELFLQKRSESKDLYPGYYTGSATGHFNHEETYDQAAQRELFEELGITAPVTRICKFKSFSEIEKEFSTLYVCHYDGEIAINTKEISYGVFLPLPQVKAELESGRKHFASGFKIAFSEYLAYLTDMKKRELKSLWTQKHSEHH